MDNAIYVLCYLTLIFLICLLFFDLNQNNLMKEEIFDNLRAANQNSLLDFKSDYANYQIIDNETMLVKWLINFVNTNNMDYEKIKIDFLLISNEPPLYVININGQTSPYIIVTKEAYINYLSITTIVNKN